MQWGGESRNEVGSWEEAGSPRALGKGVGSGWGGALWKWIRKVGLG